MLSYHSRASSTSGTDSSAAYPCCVELFTLSFSFCSSSSLVGSRSATSYLVTARLSAQGRHSLHLATELLSARFRAPTKSGLLWSQNQGHLCLPLHLWSHCSFLRDLDLFVKLRHVEEFPGCPHSIWDISCAELEMQIRLLFSLKSHAPRVAERQCLIPKTVS